MNAIKEYTFHKRVDWEMEFEIFPIEVFLRLHSKIATKPHKLNFYQLIFITEGEGVHSVDFQHIPYKAGTLIPVARHQVEAFRVNPDVKGHMLLFTPFFLMDESSTLHFYTEFLIFNSSISPIAINGTSHDIVELSDIVKRINRDYQMESDFAKQEVLRSELKLLLLRAERIKRRLSIVKCDASLALFKRFKDEIEARVNHQLGVDDYSQRLAVSRKTLNQVVKYCTGRTTKHVLDERILLEIKRLLSYSELSVKEIAFQLGFDEPTNMVKFFKKHTSYSPSHFRNTFPR